jgi:hypothetical protein
MLRSYRPFERGEFVLIFADTSWGGGDYCAAQFLSAQHLDVPLVYHSKNIATEMTPILHQEAERIGELTGVQPVVCIERNNGGVAEIERMAKLNRYNKYRIYKEKKNMGLKYSLADSPKLGWTTSTATRPIMLSMLKDAIDNKLIRLYDKPTITELFSFVQVQTSSAWKAQAESGAHDDLVMSLAGAWQMYQTERPANINRRPKKQKRYDKITGRVIS